MLHDPLQDEWSFARISQQTEEIHMTTSDIPDCSGEAWVFLNLQQREEKLFNTDYTSLSTIIQRMN